MYKPSKKLFSIQTIPHSANNKSSCSNLAVLSRIFMWHFKLVNWGNYPRVKQVGALWQDTLSPVVKDTCLRKFTSISKFGQVFKVSDISQKYLSFFGILPPALSIKHNMCLLLWQREAPWVISSAGHFWNASFCAFWLHYYYTHSTSKFLNLHHATE